MTSQLELAIARTAEEIALPRNGAVITADGRYRYVLTRTWDEELPPLIWCMLNPSTADDQVNDATIRRCLGFAKRLGHGGIVVVNLYAFRATDPRELARQHAAGVDVVGIENDVWLRRVMAMGTRSVVCGWGASAGPLPHRMHRVTAIARDVNAVLLAIGTTSGKARAGQPRHPLRTPYQTPMTEWSPP